MQNNNDNDFIFGRLQNELNQIEQQKKHNAQLAKQSERNWVSQALLDIGKVLGRIVSGTFEMLSDLINTIFSHK